ncbi:MAG: bifunctional phosphopantothenoylcysteine decarboxylase/phosphopantothenate--cysteine ligase CoaBC [Lachnospiraceae bacterium]|nr:MAG: bifunctional phosphopantothenoylcysteine decarboxylase/phosphopantothenate--cysteine ligase CoaBC [Lachnospiraceae bacterium]
MLRSKCVVIGVSGGIAAYKTANLVSDLVKHGVEVHVIMTKNATNFITPTTFEVLSGNKCIVDTFDRGFTFEVEHISLAKKADLILIAPATANIIAKLSAGIADDMLTTTVLAAKCPILVAPAMNTNMYEHITVRNNLEKLSSYGYEIIEAASGRLACGDVGKGKLADIEVLFDHIVKNIAYEKDLAGKNVLVTAGPTIEKIDPVRFISNHSSGKMGIELAKAAAYRGAKVRLILGKTALKRPEFVDIVDVVSAQDMYEAVKEFASDSDIIIKSAAVADYRPYDVADEKMKKSDGELSIRLERTIDILEYLGENKKDNQFLCGFSMETSNLIENSKLKLEKKNLDMIVANNLKEEGAGFAKDTNKVSIITKEDIIQTEVLSKKKVAHKILDEIIKYSEKKQ